MKTKIPITWLKFMGLAALMLAVCSTGNSVIILAAVAALLFLLVGDESDNLLISKLMFAGALLGLIITHSVVGLVNASRHKGPGFVDYGGEDFGQYGGLVGGDSDYEPDVQKVSASEYKRHEYSMYGTLLGFGVLLWFSVANYAKGVNKLEKEKKELEKSWVRLILNPNNVQEIQRHPENYREDFRQWIKENHPNLLLPTNRPQEVQPPRGDPEN